MTSGASWPSAAASAYAGDVRQVAARAEHAVVQLGRHAHRLGPIAVHSRSTAATAASLLAGVGQITQRLPSNSSGLAASGPTRSVPRSGDTRRTRPAAAWAHGRDRRRLDAADVEHQRRLGQLGAIAAAASPRLRTGVARTTDRRPARRLRRRTRGAIDDAQCLRAVELLLGAAPGTTSVTAPATRALSATEPPICPHADDAIDPSGGP
jgi:hypothetical protein